MGHPATSCEITLYSVVISSANHRMHDETGYFRELGMEVTYVRELPLAWNGWFCPLGSPLKFFLGGKIND